ncbi:MAG: hypothetical protein HOP29_15630 [Phycisphaerales bacterium]|nr:hypothetical protein [Phycisphaerales bacterium]
MSAARRVIVLLVLASAAAASCSQATRHRALKFFFDGVPEPGAAVPGATVAGGVESAATTEPAAGAAKRVWSAHAPYRENRCGVCHDPQTGQLFRPPQEGLCQGCHEDVPAAVRYVHGPVAVRDCLFCHHYHSSGFPSLLLDAPTATCLRCHDRADLSQEAHPGDMADIACTNCHDAHGGAERYFLK